MKNKILFFIQIVFTIISITVVTVLANQAGSSEDPLVAKSYVDEKINSLLETLNKSDDLTVATYTPVYVEKNQIVFGDEGTEIILRSGSAKAVISGVDGLTNITTGQNILDGEKINTNNLIIVPRNDGRGIQAVENCWFLIKGNYSIEE